MCVHAKKKIFKKLSGEFSLDKFSDCAKKKINMALTINAKLTSVNKYKIVCNNCK